MTLDEQRSLLVEKRRQAEMNLYEKQVDLRLYTVAKVDAKTIEIAERTRDMQMLIFNELDLMVNELDKGVN